MTRYLILDPETMKAAIVFDVEASDEQAAIDAIPADHPMPKIVVVTDAAAVAGLQRYVLSDETDGLLSETVIPAKRPPAPPFVPAQPDLLAPAEPEPVG